MKILGISSNYHDASAALVKDGKVISSAAEERLSLEKHDPSFPKLAIDYCLKFGGLKKEEIDLVVYHEDPQTKFSRTLASSFKNFPFSVSSFIKSAQDMLTAGFWIKNDISKTLDLSPEKIVTIPHHMSHAAHAFLTSPFDEAAIMTIDAVGEWSTSCIFNGKKTTNGFNIEPLDLVPFPHSLGLVYSAFTGFLGFKVNDGECSTMALAAFGKPIYAEEVRKIILINSDDSFAVDISYFDFSSDSKLPLTKKFTDVFGLPRPYKEKLEFDCLLDQSRSISPDQQRFANVAASIQVVLEEAVIAFARRTKKITGQKNLCYAGGVALNCVANSKLTNEEIFEHIYIPPDPGDGGGAMGAALYASMIFDKQNSKPRKITPYLGSDYPIDEFKKLISLIQPELWHHYTKIKTRPLKKDQIHIQDFLNEDEMISFIANEILNYKIVGWHQGRFENGPRALGNRSILCRPDCIKTAHRLSTKIKLRASFRPYACSITLQDAHEHLNINKGYELGRWMQSSFEINRSSLDLLRATSHIDGTTRAQILNELENPLYFKILSEFKKLFGVAALLNTSFNEQGYPIVASPYDALLMFARTDLDILVVNNLVISKRFE